MNNVFHIGATGLKAQQSAVDVVANNVANINTPAFKRNTVAFSGIVGVGPVAEGEGANAGRTDSGLGVTVMAAPKLLEQGELRRTDSPLDIAIRGPGFIELMAPGGQTVLWRGGGMRVNADGFLAAANGMPLKVSVSVPREAKAVLIAESGQVFAMVEGQRSPQNIGQLELVAVTDARALSALGDGLYRVDDPLADMSRGQPAEGAFGVVAQGYLEASNVKLVDEMVNMMLMQRAYAANARVVQLADEMMNTINQLRR
jgi:flagellar basal-body rod protein FlgG